MIIAFLLFSLMSLNSATIENYKIEKTVIKNGMRIIYTPMDWDGESSVFGFFFRDAGALKYKGISGLPALAERYFSARLRKLSQRKGFRFYSYLDWDYLAYVVIVPPSLYRELPQDLSRLFWSDAVISKEELDMIKKDVSIIGNKNNLSWLAQSPLINFMVPQTSVYSNGLYGDISKFEGINEKTLSDFIKCYSSPNNSVFVLTNTESVKEIENNFSQFVPCFRQNDYSLFTGAAEMALPLKTVKYLSPGNKKKYILRIGIPAYSCLKDRNAAMDILEEFLKDDPELLQIAGPYRVRNTCYKNAGSFELSFNVSGDKDPKTVTDSILKRSSLIINSIDAAKITLIKRNMIKKIESSLSDKRDFVYVLGNYEVVADDFTKVFKYRETIASVKIEEIKGMAELFNENKILTFVLWTE
jgi:predicted Zn-dependent peptidase